MKKYIIAAVVLVVALAIAPVAIGKLAERRINDNLDKLLIEVPFLSISQREFHGGWFNSELDVTFELFSGLLPGRGDGVPRLTVHNDIRHGPILGSGIGLARVKSHVVITDAEMRRELEKIFGDDQPFDINTVIGFSGGARTVVSSDASMYETKEDKFDWDALKLVIDSSSDGGAFTIDGSWPRFESKSSNGSSVAVRGMRMTGSGKRIVGDLFDSDVEFAVEEMRLEEAEKVVSFEKLHYVASTDQKGDFLDMGFRLGSGAIKANTVNLREAHYDLTIRHVHAASFDKVMSAMKASFGDTKNVSSNFQSNKDAENRDVLEFLKHDPELAIDRIAIATEEGEGIIKGTIRLRGVTLEDLQASGLGLLTKVVADIDVDISEAMLAKLAGSTESADGVVHEGLAERKDGHLVSKILFQDGKLTINGKEQAIPGLGGPAPQPAVE